MDNTMGKIGIITGQCEVMTSALAPLTDRQGIAFVQEFEYAAGLYLAGRRTQREFESVADGIRRNVALWNEQNRARTGGAECITVPV